VTDAPAIPVRVRPEIAALPAYQQGKQAGADAYKLSSNENPFDPLPGVLEAVHGATALNRYPDATAGRLRARLAERFGVDDRSVHVAAGSVSILAQLVLATSGPGDEVIFAWRSFEAYPWLAVVAGATPVQVPLTAEARHDLAAMAAAVTPRTRAILVCSPNNPTGPIVTQAEFDAFADAVPPDVLIILDEAYAEFVTDPDSVDGLRVLGAEGRAADRVRHRPPAHPRCGAQHQHPPVGDGPRRRGRAREPRRGGRAARAGPHDRRATRPLGGGPPGSGLADPGRAGQLRVAAGRCRVPCGGRGVRRRRTHRAPVRG
jgi:hypothetical protein